MTHHFQASAIPCVLVNPKVFASLHNSLSSPSKPYIGHAEFTQQVSLYFPEIVELLDEGDFGYLNLEIGALTRATKEAMGRLDFKTIRRHITFISDLYEQSDDELGNAIQVSYLENLLLNETSAVHKKVRSLLPASLEAAIRKSEAHFSSILAA